MVPEVIIIRKNGRLKCIYYRFQSQKKYYCPVRCDDKVLQLLFWLLVDSILGDQDLFLA